MKTNRITSWMTVGTGVIAGLVLAAAWTQATAAQAQTQGANVELSGLAYQPPAVTVTVGSIVTWSHADGLFMHTVTADGGAFASPNLSEGNQFTHTFTTTAVYSYYCVFHPGMRGVVAVLDFPERLYLPALGRDG